MLTRCLCEPIGDNCPFLGVYMPKSAKELCRNDPEYRAVFVACALRGGRYTEPIVVEDLYPQSVTRWLKRRRAVAMWFKQFLIGNWIARVLKLIGLSYVVKKYILIGGCGCSKRQNKLNRWWIRTVNRMLWV